jgi:arylsulfatase A-like enzyme
MARVITQLRLALSVGSVGGFVLGCREALVSLQANAAVQPEDYLLVNLSVPILAWIVLGAVVLLPVVGLLAIWQPTLESRKALGVYAGALAFAAVLSTEAPLITSGSAALEAVGFPVGLALHLLFYALAPVLAGAVALVTGVALRNHGAVVERYLPYASRAVGGLTVILVLPIVQFLAVDWKWSLPGAGTMTAADSAAAARSTRFDKVDKGGRERTEYGMYGVDGRPSVLLISIDTLRADHLGSYGDQHGLTPNLDRLAADGVVFEQAITSSPWTLPAMASLLTAQYPRQHGAGAIINERTPLGRSRLPADAWTLTRALHEHGYRTQAIVTNPYLAVRYGFGEDFDRYENITVESESFVSFSQTTALRLLVWLWPQLPVGDRGDTVSGRAVTALRRLTGSPADRGTGRPFFLWLHYIDPHAPYSRPGATRRKSMRGDLSFESGSGVKRESTSPVSLTSPDVARLRSGEIRPSAEEKERIHDLYRAEITAVDEAVGEVLAGLESFGLAARTLVVVVGDHGEEFWEHGGVEHGRTVYDEVVRVPLLMRWPRHLPAGGRVEPVVRITDVTPTILDLVGVPTPPRRDGETLMPLVRGEKRAPRVPLIENMLFAEERVGVRTADRKYVLWENGKEEVYDLAADPLERVDLAGVEGVLAPLREAYARLNADSKNVASEPSVRPGLGGRTAEALRALGYLN